MALLAKSSRLVLTLKPIKVAMLCYSRGICTIILTFYLPLSELEKWVRESVFRNTHWVGSAAMGHSEEDGVVDGRLRVFGVKQLRVADASVIPFIPNGNVHSTVVMAAFHGAELLKQDELMQGSHKKPFE